MRNPSCLTVELVRTGTSRIDRIVVLDQPLDQRQTAAIIVTGDQTLVSSNATTFHLRRSPGTVYGLVAIDGVLYSCGRTFMASHDEAATWQPIDLPFSGLLQFCIHRDRRRTWWMGCDDGVVLTSARPESGWVVAPFKANRKVLQILEVDDILICAGWDSGVWDGTTYRSYAPAVPRATDVKVGLRASDTICRITETPAGSLIAVGNGGVAYRSTDRGATWNDLALGVGVDLEDCAWVAGALFVVGGGGLLLRSTNDGVSWVKVPTETTSKLWTIASWGDGAIIGGDRGLLLRLAAPDDPYWRDAKDRFAAPPPSIDRSFIPVAAVASAEREQRHARLLAEAIAEHDERSAGSRAAQPADTNPALAAQLDDDDTATGAVYADWLLGQGDPRGELAAIQNGLAARPGDGALHAAEAALLEAHTDSLVGAFAPIALRVNVQPSSLDSRLTDANELITIRWAGGFLIDARIANTLERSPEHDGSLPEIAVPEALGWLLDAPSARFLRSLVVGIVTFSDNSYDEIAAVIGKRYLPALRSLYLGDFHSEETELNWSTLGAIEPMYAALPKLKSLTLRSSSMNLGSIVLPGLERFAVVTGGLDRGAAQAIASARWPSLRSLSVQVGRPSYGGTATLGDLQAILEATTLPRLSHLGLTNLEFTDGLIEPLARSPMLAQLTHLDLKMGTLSDDGAALLFKYQRAFEHLTQLDVDDNYLTSEGLDLLARLRGIELVVGKQRDDDDPDDRYASAVE